MVGDGGFGLLETEIRQPALRWCKNGTFVGKETGDGFKNILRGGARVVGRARVEPE